MAWADETKMLIKEISDMHDDRTHYILGLINDIQKKRKEWTAERAEVRKELLSDFSAWDEERAKKAAELRTEAQTFLAELKKQNKERAKEVKSLRAATQSLMNEFRKADYARIREIDQLKATITSMIALFRLEREKAAAAWNDLMTNTGKANKVTAAKEAKQSEKRKRKKFSGNAYDGEKILVIIKDNPKGITLPEIAYLMGVAFITITKDVKNLLTDGLIRKKENKYFLA